MAQARSMRDMRVNDKLILSGASARANLSEIMATAMADKDMEAAAMTGLAQEALMLARLNANRFLVKPDTKLADASRQASVRAASAIVDLLKHLENPKRRQLAQDTADLSKNYAAAFDDIEEPQIIVEAALYMSMNAGRNRASIPSVSGVGQINSLHCRPAAASRSWHKTSNPVFDDQYLSIALDSR